MEKDSRKNQKIHKNVGLFKSTIERKTRIKIREKENRLGRSLTREEKAKLRHKVTHDFQTQLAVRIGAVSLIGLTFFSAGKMLNEGSGRIEGVSQENDNSVTIQANNFREGLKVVGLGDEGILIVQDENGQDVQITNENVKSIKEQNDLMAQREAERNKIKEDMQELISMPEASSFKDVFENWIANMNNGEASKEASKKVIEAIENCNCDGRAKELIECLREKKDYLVKKSQWIVGGDGWAYDIGYGGLDHVLASGEDINVLVFDTEIYSNTGGQASKSTPVAAMAKFAAAGKRSKKKDLGMMAMSYGNVYVAQVGMGADKNQVLKAIREAEEYDGPSLIIAYAPCISHGLKEGMGRSTANQAQAVACGYWHLYRYNPVLKEQGKNPFTLDSKEPTESFRDFLMGQVRYSAISKQFPDVAEELFNLAEEYSKERYENYKRLANQG